MFSRRTHPESTTLEVIVPVFDPMPQQYYIRIVSDSWVGCEGLIPVSFRHVLIDGLSSPTFFTDLFDITHLPISSLADKRYEQLYENGGNDEDDLPFNAFAVNLVAWVSILGLMAFGFIWFMIQSRRQTKRLALVEIRGNPCEEKPTALVFS